MTKDSETRIHERLDEIKDDLGDIKRDMAVVVKGCSDCRPLVMGNGKASLPERVRLVEERTAEIYDDRKWFARRTYLAMATGFVALLVWIFEHYSTIH